MIQRSLRNRKDKNIFKRIEIIIGQAQVPNNQVDIISFGHKAYHSFIIRPCNSKASILS